jgi:hypothetical protein
MLILRMLFGERERTRQEPLRRGEELFEFYDSCALSGYDQFRSLINGWLEAIPEEHRAELISRMRYGGNEAFGAALCELMVAIYLTKLNLKIAFHPNIAGSTTRVASLNPCRVIVGIGMIE